MSTFSCSHKLRRTGVLQCDLTRNAGPPALYSINLKVNICNDCGHTELFCESYQSVCAWLATNAEPSPKPGSGSTLMNDDQSSELAFKVN